MQRECARLDEFKPDIAMHLAAESHVDRSIDGPDTFIQTNIVGTYAMLEAARGYWGALSTKSKLILDFITFLPMRSMVLWMQKVSLRRKHPMIRVRPIRRVRPSDHLVMAWYHTYGLPIVLTNCSNNYGPYHFPEKLIPLVILNALDELPLPIYGKGDQIRDWLYVDDHARALVLVDEVRWARPTMWVVA